MERMFERTFYAARWFLAPVFFGLSLALIALAIKFFQEIFHVLPHVLTLSEADLILSLLSLIDMGLVAPEGKQIKEGLQMLRGYIF